MKKFEILNLDRLEFLKKIEKNKVQLIITSPPYNIGKDYEKKLPFKKYLEEQKEKERRGRNRAAYNRERKYVFWSNAYEQGNHVSIHSEKFNSKDKKYQYY